MPLPLLIPAALGVAEAGIGLLKSGQAKREAARLAASRPKLKDSPFINDQLSLAKSELANGMSGEAENAYEQGLSRDLSTSLDTILKGGGDVNNVADIFDKSATGRQRLSLMKENLRLSQINNLSRAQGASEDERLQQFQFNEWSPWADAAQSNAQAKQGSENMIWSGLQTAAGAATGMIQGQQQQNDFNNYFSSGNGNRGGNSPNIQSSTVRGTANPQNTFNSPGTGRGYLDPSYIDNSIFQ